MHSILWKVVTLWHRKIFVEGDHAEQKLLFLQLRVVKSVPKRFRCEKNLGTQLCEHLLHLKSSEIALKFCLMVNGFVNTLQQFENQQLKLDSKNLRLLY